MIGRSKSRLGASSRAGDDLATLAVGERVFERNDAAVNWQPAAAVAEGGVVERLWPKSSVFLFVAPGGTSYDLGHWA